MYPKEITLQSYNEEAKSPGRSSRVGRVDSDSGAAFEEIFQLYHSMVFHLAYRLLGDREEALDVAQEVFFTIYRKMGLFRGDSALKTWIYRIAINRASNRFRWWNRLRRRGTVSLDEALTKDDKRDLSETLEAAGRSPEEDLLAQEQNAQIQRSLLRLPVQQRIAVIMRDIDGMSYEEIAEATQASLGTVKSRIARGRGELKRHLNGALG